MPKSNASTDALAAVGSHFVTLGPHDTPTAEEVWPRLDVTWRGDRFRVNVSADRYEHSSGWSEWRIYAKDAYYPGGDSPFYGEAVPMTDTARRAISDAVRPLVAAWLAGEAEADDGSTYVASYRRALGHAIRRLADAPAGYTVERFADAVRRHQEQLDPATADRMTRAAGCLLAASELLALNGG